MIKVILSLLLMMCAVNTHSASQPGENLNPRFSSTEINNLRLVSVKKAKTDFGRKDIQCLTDNLYYEARGEGIKGMHAVGNVVFNRLKDPRWPSSICAIVYQPYQFSWTNKTDRQRRKPQDKQARLASRLVAGALLRAWYREGIDSTGGATMFHEASLRPPGWVTKSKRLKRIGRHIFYQLHRSVK